MVIVSITVGVRTGTFKDGRIVGGPIGAYASLGGAMVTGTAIFVGFEGVTSRITCNHGSSFIVVHLQLGGAYAVDLSGALDFFATVFTTVTCTVHWLHLVIVTVELTVNKVLSLLTEAMLL